MSQSTTIYNRSKTWQIVCYAFFGSISNLFMITMMFSTYVATGGYLIPVVTASLIASGSRVFDAVTDPIVGFIGNRINTKFGKVRPLVITGYLLMAISILSMLFVFVGKGTLLFALSYGGYILGSTIFMVGKQIGDVAMTNDPKQRPKISRWSSIYTTILSAFSSFYLSKVLFRKHGGLNIAAFQELGATVCVLAGILVIAGVIAVWEKDNPEMYNKYYRKAQKINLRDCWNLLKENRALTMLVIARSTDKLALQTASNSAISMMVFGIIIGNYSFSGTLSLINVIPTILLIFMSTKLASDKGTRHSFISWTWIAVGISAVMFIFMLIVDPKTISVSIMPTVIFVALNALLSGVKLALNACTLALTPDISDYEFYRSGKFMPSVIGSLNSFVDKLVSSLASTIVGLCLALIGYTSTMPQATDPSSPQIFRLAMFLWIGMPVLGWIASIVSMKWYPLTKEKMEEIQQQNYLTRQTAEVEVEAK